MQSCNNSFFPPELLLKTATHTWSLSIFAAPKSWHFCHQYFTYCYLFQYALWHQNLILMHLLLKKWNSDFSCTASAVSHYFFLFKSPQLRWLYGTHLCNAGTLLFCNHPPCGSRNKETTSCSLSGGNWGGSSKDRSRAGSVQWVVGVTLPGSHQRSSTQPGSISGEHRASSPKAFQCLLPNTHRGAVFQQLGTPLCAGMAGFWETLGICSWMHLELEFPTSD